MTVPEKQNPALKFELSNQVPEDVCVSVLILTYNQAAYIADALDGALAQAVDFPIEICVGEDGSTDGTREICMDYANRYPDIIRLFLRDRSRVAGLSGYEAAMLNGTETRDACRGKYIAICDGDDYWTDPLKLALQIAYHEQHPECAMSFHPVRQMLPDGSFSEQLPTRYRRSDGRVAARTVLLGGGQYMATSATVYRRSALYRQLPQFLSTAVVGDLPTQVILASRGHTMFFAKPMAVYRRHATGSWSDLQQQASAKALHFSKVLVLWQQLVDFLPWRLKAYALLRAAYESYKFATRSEADQTCLSSALGDSNINRATLGMLMWRVSYFTGRLVRVRSPE